METRQEQILKAAWKLFERHGFKKVSMADIAEATNISRPTLYGVFSSKEDIIDQIARNSWQGQTEKTLQAIEKEKNLKRQLDLLFKNWIIDPELYCNNDVPAHKELTSTIHLYAPKAVDDFYNDFKNCAEEILKIHLPKKSKLNASDLAQVLAMSAKGFKSSSPKPAELQKLVDGLIVLTLSFIEK